MRGPTAGALLFLLSACSTEAEPHRDAMDRIEQKLRLPEGAVKLEEYARYYAPEGNRIVATYIMHVDPTNRYYDLPIGRRRWIENYRDLPRILDGGCDVVRIIYDTASQKTEAFCNGA